MKRNIIITIISLSFLVVLATLIISINKNRISLTELKTANDVIAVNSTFLPTTPPNTPKMTKIIETVVIPFSKKDNFLTILSSSKFLYIVSFCASLAIIGIIVFTGLGPFGSHKGHSQLPSFSKQQYFLYQTSTTQKGFGLIVICALLFALFKWLNLRTLKENLPLIKETRSISTSTCEEVLSKKEDEILKCEAKISECKEKFLAMQKNITELETKLSNIDNATILNINYWCNIAFDYIGELPFTNRKLTKAWHFRHFRRFRLFLTIKMGENIRSMLNSNDLQYKKVSYYLGYLNMKTQFPATYQALELPPYGDILEELAKIKLSYAATCSEVKRQYRSLLAKQHPDKNKLDANAQDKFIQLTGTRELIEFILCGLEYFEANGKPDTKYKVLPHRAKKSQKS